jgi:hypothetical protein
MNETEDSNKNRNKNMQNDETTPKYVGYDENKLQEMKTIERKQFPKLTQNKLVYDELSPNLEPKVNDVKLS